MRLSTLIELRRHFRAIDLALKQEIEAEKSSKWTPDEQRLLKSQNREPLTFNQISKPPRIES